jgi:hypothetical protein
LSRNYGPLATRVDDESAGDLAERLLTGRAVGHADVLTVVQIGVDHRNLFEDPGAARAGVFQQDLVEAVSLDVQGGAYVAKVLECRLTNHAIPHDWPPCFWTNPSARILSVTPAASQYFQNWGMRLSPIM